MERRRRAVTIRSDYSARIVTAAWTTGSSSVSAEEDPVAVWDMEPRDVERVGRLIRLDIAGAARAWLDGASNFGILVEAEGVDAAELAADLDQAKLSLRYGSVR